METGPWYAVWTRSNHERLAVAQLQDLGVTAYLPAAEVPSLRRDRHVLLHRPLFPGYFFVRSALDRADRVAILRAPGVVSILGSKAGPRAVPDWQVRSVRVALESRNPIEVFYGLVPGKAVRVLEGPLAGMEGVVLSSQDGEDKIVVSIEILGRSLAVRLACAQVRAA